MMSTRKARIFVPQNHLAKSLIGPDRTDFSELVELANVRVAKISGRVEAFVLERSAVLLALLQHPASDIYERRHEVLATAAEIAATAGPGRSETIGLFSRGVYHLICGMEEQGIWRADILEVHTRSFTLAYANPDLNGLSEVLANLAEARASIGIVG